MIFVHGSDQAVGDTNLPSRFLPVFSATKCYLQGDIMGYLLESCYKPMEK